MNNHDIIIHQAFYGEKNNGHTCLSSSIEDSELKAYLTGFTDRSGFLHAGVNMEPYYSGIAFSNYYIFTLTFPDFNSRRSGMVFTHVLIVNVSDIGYLDSITHLFSHFCTSIPEDKSLIGELRVPIRDFQQKAYKTVFPKFVVTVVQKLIEGDRAILFCGARNSFVTLISSIWTGLPELFRVKFSYSAGFSPVNIDESKTLIYVQPTIEDLFKNSDYISDTANSEIELNSTVEKYILTPSQGNGLELFIKSLEVDLNSWEIFQSCVRAYTIYADFQGLTNEALKQLVRQLAKIAPDKNQGQFLKNKVFLELKERVRSGKEIHLKSLRNLPLSAYHLGENLISNSISHFIESEFNKSDGFNTELISGIAIESKKSESCNWWNSAIQIAFTNVINNLNTIRTHNFWRLLIVSESTLKVVLPFLPSEKVYEDKLLKLIPDNIMPDVAELFVSLIKKRNWYLLHSRLVRVYLQPKEAVTEQLLFEKTFLSSSFVGTKFLLEELTNNNLLLLIMETREIFFVFEYANRCSKEPLLLSSLDVNNEMWLLIWDETLKITRDIEYGINELSEKIHELLNIIAEGKTVPEKILSEIGSSKYCDISGYERRSDIWRNLDQNVVGMFLNATAITIVRKAVLFGKPEEKIEPELEKYILSDNFIEYVLQFYKCDIDAILVICDLLRLQDSILSNFIYRYNNQLTNIQSSKLGGFILSKRFHLSAKQVFEKAKTNISFTNALAECQSLLNLGFFERLVWTGLLGLQVKVTRADLNIEFKRLSIKLYEKGPEDQDIWKRAGGDLSKLHNDRTREECWNYAIDLLLKGGGGKGISIKSLIAEMIEDHPNNQELQIIKDYY